MLEALHPLAKKRKMADVDSSMVDAAALSIMGRRELEELSRQLKLAGRGDVPSPWVRRDGRQVRCSVEEFRSAMAAYLHIELQDLGGSAEVADVDLSTVDAAPKPTHSLLRRSIRAHDRRPSSICARSRGMHDLLPAADGDVLGAGLCL